MSSKSLVKVLRKIIREEVRAAVKEVLTEEPVNHKQVIERGMKLSEISKNTKTKKTKSFSKNSMLNDILNETAGTADFSTMNEGPLVSQGIEESYPSMGDFKSSMAESFGMSRKPQTLATHDINNKPIDMNNEQVAKTIGLMTKDYSGVMAKMKEMDKTKGKKVV